MFFNFMCDTWKPISGVIITMQWRHHLNQSYLTCFSLQVVIKNAGPLSHGGQCKHLPTCNLHHYVHHVTCM